MARICSRRGCRKQVSAVRLARGLKTCATHGRKLLSGNPGLRRRECRICTHSGCVRRLSRDRLEVGARMCLQHGGPIPWRIRPAQLARFDVLSQFVLSSTDLAAPAINSAPWGPVSRLQPAEEQLLNILLLRRTGLPQHVLGWKKTWCPDEVLQWLCDHAMQGWHQLPSQHSGATRQALKKASMAHNAADIREHVSLSIIRPIDALWSQRGRLLQVAKQPLWYPLLSLITNTYGHGPFWANVVGFDMRAQRLATPYPRDRQVCCGFGPGGLRGLNAVLGRNPTAPLERQVALIWAKHLSDHVRWPQPSPEAYIVQWWLCELSQAPASLWS